MRTGGNCDAFLAWWSGCNLFAVALVARLAPRSSRRGDFKSCIERLKECQTLMRRQRVRGYRGLTRVRVHVARSVRCRPKDCRSARAFSSDATQAGTTKKMSMLDLQQPTIRVQSSRTTIEVTTSRPQRLNVSHEIP